VASALGASPQYRTTRQGTRCGRVLVFYTLVGGPNPTPADIVDPGIAPREGEWVVQRGPDKFLGSPLEERLKAHGIKTVIATGTSAQGAVVGTGSGAAQRGYKVIVPVDGMSAEDPYVEQYAAVHDRDCLCIGERECREARLSDVATS
jgi:nicotinamidase-related amidase